MFASMKAFMGQIIDYAGLFPPAALPLESAIRHYAAYRNGPDAWMLGNFVLAATQLPQLDAYMPLFTAERPLPLAVVIGRSKSAEGTLYLLQDGLTKIGQLRKQHGASIRIGMLELPLPPAAVDRRLLANIASTAGAEELQVFCEMTHPLHDNWEANMRKALDEIALFNGSGPLQPGVKLRTGGVTADAFPTPGQVAVFLAECRDRGLAMKFTAGLHHPVRMYREEVGTNMHGFLNVFMAGLLAHTHMLNVAEIEQMMAEENPASFSFAEEGLGWRELSVSARQVETLRNRVLCAFGSCSFDEPREELRQLYPFEQRCG
ncbi:hypothetical protein [Paenibacillus cymbidii]|uniref:hypothetical protein n=1 Tax=Paenibacillus cymbidii TaxID=1639034 RepID=UPI00107FE669|nr:hypothetical protein [Paenibacillus cymbidii]